MILVLSQSHYEPSTEDVMDWLTALGAECLRLNLSDLEAGALTFRLDASGTTLRLAGDGLSLAVDDVEAVWLRRWYWPQRHARVPLFGADRTDTRQAHLDLVRHLNLEYRRASELLFSRLAGVPWLTTAGSTSPNKLAVLEAAAAAGLAIPRTLVTNRRDELRRFAAECGVLITKALGEAANVHLDERFHSAYTQTLTAEDVEALPERFGLSLFQERLAKAFELRVFHLAGDSYAMAIFSQGDPQTAVDFRQYSTQRPNRNVPFRLSAELAGRIATLMERLELETGSLDLVRTPDGRTVFLEVNVVGQFGMVSQPCNYPLERKVAEHLIAKAERGRAQDAL